MLLDGSESGMVPLTGGKCDMRWSALGEELKEDSSRKQRMEPILNY